MHEFLLLVCFVLEVLDCRYCVYIYIKECTLNTLVSMRCVSPFNILVNQWGIFFISKLIISLQCLHDFVFCLQ